MSVVCGANDLFTDPISSCNPACRRLSVTANFGSRVEIYACGSKTKVWQLSGFICNATVHWCRTRGPELMCLRGTLHINNLALDEHDMVRPQILRSFNCVTQRHECCLQFSMRLRPMSHYRFVPQVFVRHPSPLTAVFSDVREPLFWKYGRLFRTVHVGLPVNPWHALFKLTVRHR